MAKSQDDRGFNRRSACNCHRAARWNREAGQGLAAAFRTLRRNRCLIKRVAKRGDQAGKPYRICEKAGGKQKGTCDQKTQTFYQRCRR